MKNNLGINIVANYLGRIWGVLSNFIFIPLYIYFLGFESYSIISFTLIVAGLLAVLDAGLTATLSREFARSDVSFDDKVKTYNTLECIYLITVAVCISLIFLSSDFISEYWISTESYTAAETSFFLKIMSFDIGFQLLFRFYMGGLLGLEKQVKANLQQIGWGVLRNGLVVLVIMFWPSLDMFFIWQAISTIFFTVVIKLLLEKEFNGYYNLKFSLRINKDVFISIWSFAGGMLLIAVVAAVNTQIDKLLISKLISLKSLGYYTLAVSLSQGLIVLINPICTALLPRFTSYYSVKDNALASSLFKSSGVFVSLLVFSFMANMFFFGKELVWIWTGDKSLAENVFIILPIIVIAYGMLALQFLPYNVAIANGYTKLNNILGIVSLFVTVPGYFLATRLYGSVGAATVFCIVQVISTLIYLYFINRKFIKIRLFVDIYGRQIFIPFLVTFSLAFLFSIIPGFSGYGRFVNLIWIGASTCLTILITALIVFPVSSLKHIIKFKFIK